MEMSKEKINAMKSVKRNGHNLKHFSSFANDIDVVMMAVTNDMLANGHELALSFASEELRDEEQVVLAAVKHCGLALEFASERLQGNREIVFNAVHNEPYSLVYASDEIRNDMKFLAKIVKDHPFAIKGAGDDIQDNKDAIVELAAINPEIIKHLKNKEIKKELINKRKVSTKR